MTKNETKRDKFVRLAEKRVLNALKQIELISNLSNKNAYEYNANDIEKIFKTLRSAIRDAESKFSINNDNNHSFKLR